MRQSQESKRTRKLCAELKKHNAYVIALVAQIMQAPGLPDRFIAHHYISGGAWVEFKDWNTALRTNQKLTLQALRERGTLAVVARFTEDGQSIIIQNEEGSPLAECHTSANEFLLALGSLS